MRRDLRTACEDVVCIIVVLWPDLRCSSAIALIVLALDRFCWPPNTLQWPWPSSDLFTICRLLLCIVPTLDAMQTGTPKLLPEGTVAVPATKGKSCEAACAAVQKECDTSAAALEAVNTCDALRAHFPCEAGCTEGSKKPEAPSYVVYGSQKAQFPTMCFISPEGEKSECTAESSVSVRLCACCAPTVVK